MYDRGAWTTAEPSTATRSCPRSSPLLIEFLASYRLAEPLAALSVRDADPPLPPFQADPRLEVARQPARE